MRRAGARRLVGEKIRLDGLPYIIVGVLQDTPGWGMRQFNTNRSVFVPVSTSLRAFDDAKIESITARMAPHVHYTAAAEEVQGYFRHKVKDLKLEVQSAEQLIEQMEKQMQLFTLLLGAIGSISLIVGGVGVMNVMLVSVTERRKEIGIRRALGARRRDIQSQFLIESVILSLVGGLFGIALGIGASYIICHFTGWTFHASTAAVLLGFGVASAVGIFFGFYPAYQAAWLNPITALRAE
jgi:putative ABC transport system permease protein